MHPKDVVTREDCIAICIFIPRIHVQQFYNIFQQKEDERFLWAHTLNAKERNVMEVIIKLKANHRALFFAFLESLCRNHGFRLHKEND